MGKPITRNLDLYIGDDFVYAFRVYDVDTNQVRTPRDLTGATGLMQIRAEANPASTLIATATFDDTDVADGWCTFIIADTITVDIEPGVYWYDMEVNHTYRKTYLRGEITATQQITANS